MSKTHTITLIPGDGIGPEVTAAVIRVLDATGVKIEWDLTYLEKNREEKLDLYLPANRSRKDGGSLN